MAISHLKKSLLQLFTAIWVRKRQRRSIRLVAEAKTDDLLIEALSKPLSMVRFWNRAAEKAVELDPNLAEAQTVLAMVRFWNERDWPSG